MTANLAYAMPVHAHDETVDLVRRGEVVATEVAYRGPETGERALMRAVLQDAILCLRGHATGVPRRARRRAADQAQMWIAARDTAWPFSFESICHVLGLDPGSLRRKLLREVLTDDQLEQRGERTVWREGGMVSLLRSVRMRGNQRRGRLKLRQRRRRAGTAAAQRRDSGASDHRGECAG
jgi:hypothetical protein